MPTLSDPFGKLFAPDPQPNEHTEAFLHFLHELDCSLVFAYHSRKSLAIALQLRPQGLYIQLRVSGEIYIGKALDLYRRTIDHQENGVVLSCLALIPFDRTVSAEELDEAETALIARALLQDLPLANLSKIHVAQERNLQQWRRDSVRLFPNDPIEAWFDEHFFAYERPLFTFSRLYQQATPHERALYATCLQDPAWQQAFLFLHPYVSQCLPLARELVLRRWNLACRLDSDGLWEKAELFAGNRSVFSVAVFEDCPDTLRFSLELSRDIVLAFWANPYAYFRTMQVDCREHCEEPARRDAHVLRGWVRHCDESERQELITASEKTWSQVSHKAYFTLSGTTDNLLQLLAQQEILFAASLHALSCMRFSGKPPSGHALLAYSLL